MTVIETRLQILHICIMQQTLVFLMRLQQSMYGRYREKLGEDGYKLACAQNALPENFEQLSYPEFLNQRRLLMAQIVKKAYHELNK